MNATRPDQIEKRFVHAAGRQWHVLVAGRGPPLLALHRAPLTAESLTELFARNRQFTIIAPDLPGHGGTAPGIASGSLDDYARALDALLVELRCPALPVIGEREGGLIALALAALSPDRVTAVVGIAIGGGGLRVLAAVPPSDATAPDPDRQLPDLTPRFDGSHLAALWGWLREDALFRPWWSRRLESRVLESLPRPTELHRRVVQVLRSSAQGREFAQLLRAAAVDPESLSRTVANLKCPVLVTDAADEPGDAALRALAFAESARHAASGDWRPADADPAGATIRGRLVRDYVGPPGAQLHYLHNADAETVPLLVQHDAASSVGTVRPIVESFVGRRSVFAFDLPGSGDSDDTLPADPLEVDVYAARLLEALDALGLGKVDFYGMWGGGFVGLELARLAPGRVRRLILSNVFFHEGAERVRFQEDYTPALEPAWHGGHLLQAWHQMRDQGLFYPWFDRSAAGVIRREPFLDTDMVHERVCSLLKAGNRYRSAYQAHFVYPVLDRLREVAVPTLLATSDWDPNRPHTELAARANPHCRFQLLDPDFRRWGESFCGFLEA